MLINFKNSLQLLATTTAISSIVFLNFVNINATSQDNLASSSNMTRLQVNQPVPATPLENSTVMNQAKSLLPEVQTDSNFTMNDTRTQVSNVTEPQLAKPLVNATSINATNAPLPLHTK